MNSDSSYGFAGIDDRYLVVGERSNKGRFSLVTLIPDRSVLEKLPYVQWIIKIILWGPALYMGVVLLILRKVVLTPINRIVTEMRRIKRGLWEARIPSKPTSNEFELIHETFNGMASEIQQLKINIYEEELINQKAELKYLQLQINPHFS